MLEMCVKTFNMGFLQEGDGEKISLKDATVFETSSKNTTHTFTVCVSMFVFVCYICCCVLYAMSVVCVLGRFYTYTFFNTDSLTSSATDAVSFFT